MKLFYPASNDLLTLSEWSTSMKIARYIPCEACDGHCPGLRPPADAEVVRDDRPVEAENSLTGLVEYGSDDDVDDIPTDYLRQCSCGHNAKEHGADEEKLGKAEYERRAGIAVRIDELLKASGELLNFDYTDSEIESLRHRMKLPESVASPLTEAEFASPTALSSAEKHPLSSISSQLSEELLQPPTKRRRISSSSLSDAEDDEEDRPLAARMTGNAVPSNGTRVHPRRSGKKTSSMKSKAQTAPASIPPPTGEEQAEMNGEIPHTNGHDIAVRADDQMDEGQIDRLATGVTVDTASPTTTAPPIKPEKPSALELRRGVIKIIPVENDGEPRSLVILTNLKTLFQKQLPVMPREYIARLVYDCNSKCLAICKRGYKVVGGICYRPFLHRGFAEIVFFATASVDQEKGYGGLLMDHFKAHIRRTYPEMMHFLTYADNYAVGYFKKQGFSKEITLDRAVWAGYIKDYEGGTIMQCTMLRRVDYLATKELIAKQREAILTKIRQMSKSHIVYEGLPQFQNGEGEGVVVDPKDVPGLRESGWTPAMAATTRPTTKNTERSAMERILSDLQAHPQGWPFREPVKTEEVPDYHEVISNPMDFGAMERKLETGQYTTLDSFIEDAQLVFDNAKVYNPEDSIYYKNAVRMERLLKEHVNRFRETG
ncbi:hypothetical protein EW146_g1247 [Bondarzewia mesenterica]|uniref:histone acetyltransferase n=1 Tax=Bondarzewia mesenterica TaxID=1095465 RepID=A0A4S4M5Y3_9AGAM|nr:hypothetical protein EW146_g1247 [Bondarzewia mesenterica]